MLSQVCLSYPKSTELENLLSKFDLLSLQKEGVTILLHYSRGVILLISKYAPFQKNVIEEMVNSGVVRPSHSAFASPVLIKKKDGSLRFCEEAESNNH